ncbi:hypothetical protein ACLKA6_017560 [Drosophila palustris]
MRALLLPYPWEALHTHTILCTSLCCTTATESMSMQFPSVLASVELNCRPDGAKLRLSQSVWWSRYNLAFSWRTLPGQQSRRVASTDVCSPVWWVVQVVQMVRVVVDCL